MKLRIEVVRSNKEVQRFVVINANVVNKCGSCNIIAIEKQHMDISSIIKKMSQNITSVIDPTHYINIAKLRMQ